MFAQRQPFDHRPKRTPRRERCGWRTESRLPAVALPGNILLQQCHGIISPVLNLVRTILPRHVRASGFRKHVPIVFIEWLGSPQALAIKAECIAAIHAVATPLT